MTLPNEKIELLKKGVNKINDLFEKGGHPILDEWKTASDILDEHKEKLDESKAKKGKLDKDDLLPVCLILDGLYGTNIPPGHIPVWVEQLVDFLGEKRNERPDPAWIKELIDEKQAGLREERSFLFKFFHFFVDKEKFPIYDRYARKAAGVILRGKRFPTYAARIEELAEHIEGDDKLRRLDRFLWVAGHYLSKGQEKEKKNNVKNYWADFFKEIGEPSGLNGIIEQLTE